MRSIGNSVQAKNNNQRCGKKLWFTKNFEKGQTLHKSIIRIFFSSYIHAQEVEEEKEEVESKESSEGDIQGRLVL